MTCTKKTDHFTRNFRRTRAGFVEEEMWHMGLPQRLAYSALGCMDQGQPLEQVLRRAMRPQCCLLRRQAKWMEGGKLGRNASLYGIFLSKSLIRPGWFSVFLYPFIGSLTEKFFHLLAFRGSYVTSFLEKLYRYPGTRCVSLCVWRCGRLCLWYYVWTPTPSQTVSLALNWTSIVNLHLDASCFQLRMELLCSIGK